MNCSQLKGMLIFVNIIAAASVRENLNSGKSSPHFKSISKLWLRCFLVLLKISFLLLNSRILQATQSLKYAIFSYYFELKNLQNLLKPNGDS